MSKVTKKRRAETAATNREIIRNGYVVTFCQYDSFVDHEYFRSLDEMLERIAYYDEIFMTVSVIGIRQKGRTLSPSALEEIMRLLPSH